MAAAVEALDTSMGAEAPPDRRNAILAYCGLLAFAIPLTGISGTAVTAALKDRLGMSSDAIALFFLIAGIPAYFGFLFGNLRDRWAPFGRKDQGILILFSGFRVLLFVGLALAKLSIPMLLTMVLLNAAAGQFIGSAQQGLTSALGQAHLMSGRIVAVWKALDGLPGLFVSILAGMLADRFLPAQVFWITAAVSAGLFAISLLRPKAVYDDPAESRPLSFSLDDLKRLAGTKALYPCAFMLFLWNFTPGVGTPMVFYMRDTLHGSYAQIGWFNAIFGGFFIPTYLLHGYLSTRLPLNRILWISTVFAVPQILPLLIIHNASSALWAGVPMGLMGGFATAAYFDLLVRACPKGMEGTVMMLGSSVWALSGDLGNVAGSKLYAMAGFAPCAWSTFAVYALLLVVLPFVPKRLTAYRDGEQQAAIAA